MYKYILRGMPTDTFWGADSTKSFSYFSLWLSSEISEVFQNIKLHNVMIKYIICSIIITAYLNMFFNFLKLS